jgi:very-short-patch-repair endonuclease
MYKEEMLLTEYAKGHRKNQTDAEILLWKHLRRHQLDNTGFRRQQPVGPFIPDFISFGARIVIELDGGQHSQLAIQDHKRDQWFEDQGFQVLRFWNNEVLGNIEGVLNTIFQELKRGNGRGHKS